MLISLRRMELPRTSSSSPLNKEIIGTLDALFYVASKPVSLDTIVSVLKLGSRKEAEEIMEAYVKHFNSKMIGLEIVRRRKHYFPKIKDRYIDKVKNLMRPPPLTEKQLEVLAYIYTRKKVKLSRLKDIFGNRVYRDVKKFIRLGLVTKKSEDTGFTVIIREEAEALIRSRRGKKREKIVKKPNI